MEISFEEIAGEYRLVKKEKDKIDLLFLKSRIESYIRNRQDAAKGDYRVAEAQEMLMDVTYMIEEGRCSPFRARKL